MKVTTLFRRNSLWTTAVYVQSHLDLPPNGEPCRLFATKKLWRGPSHVHTRADPFLHVHGKELFLFCETMAGSGPAWIEAYKTIDLINFSSLGVILKETGDLSYPFVFETGSEVYMIPETVFANQVRLYRFNDFPKDPVKVRVLLWGDYVDTSAIKLGDTWFLFTTSETRGLELFYTHDLIKGDLIPHPRNPITNDARFRRCGGAPVRIDKTLYRLAQDCSRTYGGNLNLMEIETLSHTDYNERLARENIFRCDRPWNRQGGHHASVVMFNGSTVVAIDGKQYDHYLIHKIVRGAYWLATGDAAAGPSWHRLAR
jgi:hypothetical protein